MTDLSQQTEQLLNALTRIHNDLIALQNTAAIASVFIVALLIILVFRRRRK